MYLNWTFCAAWCLFGIIFSHCSQLMRVRKSSRVTASTNTKLLLLFKQLSAHVHTTHTSQCRSETSSSRLQQRWVPHCALWMNDFLIFFFLWCAAPSPVPTSETLLPCCSSQHHPWLIPQEGTATVSWKAYSLVQKKCFPYCSPKARQWQCESTLLA